jgi:thiol-disulfide isomerase/thioredoxin
MPRFTYSLPRSIVWVFAYLLLGVSPWMLAAQGPVTVAGRIIGTPPNVQQDWLYLLEYQGNETFRRDSCKLSPEGNFKLESKLNAPLGLYQVGFSEQFFTKLAVVPGRALQCTLDFADLKGGLPAKAPDLENELYAQLERYARQREDIQRQLNWMEVMVQHQIPEQKDMVVAQWQTRAEQELNIPLRILAQQHPESLVIQQWLTIYLEPLPNPVAGNYQAFIDHQYQHMLGDLDWAQPALAHHDGLCGWLYDYLACYAATQSFVRLRGGLDQIVQHANAQPLTLGVVGSYLINTLYEMMLTEMTYHLLSTPPLSQCQTLNKAAQGIRNTYSNVLAGKAFPTYPLQDVKMQPRTAQEIAKAGALTLVIFWSAGCDHCRKAWPMFQELYNEFGQSGLQIFAIGMDQERAQWEAGLDELKLPGTHVHDPKSWAGPIPSTFAVEKTPGVYLLRSDGTIHRGLVHLDFVRIEIESFFN